MTLEAFTSIRTAAIFPSPTSDKIWYGQFGYGSNGGAANITAAGGIMSAVLGTPDSGFSKHQLYLRTVDNVNWHFIRMCQMVPTYTGPSSYTNGIYNRMRFKVKMPLSHDADGGFRHNFEMASFLHNFSASDGALSGSDDNNWHFYHFMDIPGDGLWWQCLLDTRVNHQRGPAGDYGDKEFPSSSGNNNGKTYFDLMSAFYFDMLSANTPGDVFQVGPITFSHSDEASALLLRAYAVTGTFNPANNTVSLIWQRGFNNTNDVHDVAWSFSPITNFASATSVGTATGGPDPGYTTMRKNFSNAAFANEDYLWIAIRPSGRTDFRLFYIDLTMND